MSWKQLLSIIIESPLYWTMAISDRKIYVVTFLERYEAKFC